MRDAWQVKEYREGDERGLLKLYESIYGEVVDKNQWLMRWNWRHRDNPAGASIIWLAESKSKIVGQYMISRVKMKIGDEVMTCSQSLETMTHPDYRRQGIFIVLANKTYEEAREKGIDVIYGFPNQYSHPGFIRDLGWFDVCSFRTVIKPLNLENILGKYIPNKLLVKIFAKVGSLAINIPCRTRKFPKVEGLTITRVSSFDDRISSFWKRTSNDHGISVVRDKEYLNWRYVHIPDVNYTIYLAEQEKEILGYIILRCKGLRGLVVGYIFDFIFPLDRQDVAQCLILRAVEHFKQENADLICYHMIEPKIYRKICRKNGFIFPHFISRRSPFIARINAPKISEAFLRNSRHWFVQMGDSDWD